MAKAKSEKTDKKGGMPPHKPTDETRRKARLLSGYAVPREQIAIFLGINTDTLAKYYNEDLEKGKMNANRKVVRALLKKALEGDTTACIWWTKARLGWTEKSEITHSGSVTIIDDVK